MTPADPDAHAYLFEPGREVVVPAPRSAPPVPDPLMVVLPRLVRLAVLGVAVGVGVVLAAALVTCWPRTYGGGSPLPTMTRRVLLSPTTVTAVVLPPPSPTLTTYTTLTEVTP